MNIQNFEPYQQVIEASIKSCISREQLHCCWHLIAHFETIFKPVVNASEMMKATEALYVAYGAKAIML